MYNEAVQNVLSSRLDLTFNPKCILKALAQTFDEDQKGASTSFDAIDQKTLDEEVGLRAFKTLAKGIKSEDAIGEIVTALLATLPQVSSRAKVLEKLAAKFGIEMRFSSDGRVMEIIYADDEEEDDTDEKQSEEIDGKAAEEASERPESKEGAGGISVLDLGGTRIQSNDIVVKLMGTALNCLLSKVAKCRALDEFLQHADLEEHNEPEDGTLNTLGTPIQTLLESLGDIQSRTKLLTYILPKVGVPLPKRGLVADPLAAENPETAYQDEGEDKADNDEEFANDFDYADDELTNHDHEKESTAKLRPAVGTEAAVLTRMDTLLATIPDNDERRHVLRSLVLCYGLGAFDSPIEANRVWEAEVHNEVD
jgi:hypothetical protein